MVIHLVPSLPARRGTCARVLAGTFVFLMYWTGQDWYDQRLVFPLTFYVATHFAGPFLLNPVLTRGYY